MENREVGRNQNSYVYPFQTEEPNEKDLQTIDELIQDFQELDPDSRGETRTTADLFCLKKNRNSEEQNRTKVFDVIPKELRDLQTTSNRRHTVESPRAKIRTTSGGGDSGQNALPKIFDSRIWSDFDPSVKTQETTRYVNFSEVVEKEKPEKKGRRNIKSWYIRRKIREEPLSIKVEKAASQKFRPETVIFSSKSSCLLTGPIKRALQEQNIPQESYSQRIHLETMPRLFFRLDETEMEPLMIQRGTYPTGISPENVLQLKRVDEKSLKEMMANPHSPDAQEFRNAACFAFWNKDLDNPVLYITQRYSADQIRQFEIHNVSVVKVGEKALDGTHKTWLIIQNPEIRTVLSIQQSYIKSELEKFFQSKKEVVLGDLHPLSDQVQCLLTKEMKEIIQQQKRLSNSLYLVHLEKTPPLFFNGIGMEPLLIIRNKDGVLTLRRVDQKLLTKMQKEPKKKEYASLIRLQSLAYWNNDLVKPLVRMTQGHAIDSIKSIVIENIAVVQVGKTVMQNTFTSIRILPKIEYFSAADKLYLAAKLKPLFE